MESYAQNVHGVLRLRPVAHSDPRGHIEVIYQQSVYRGLGILDTWVQENVVYSRRNVLRGMHLQPGQAKLIRVLSGSILDNVSDRRPESPTYGKSARVPLHASEALYVPAGCAHGFCVMSDHAVVSYLLSAEYDPRTERAYAWNDPLLALGWPTDAPVLSERDAATPHINLDPGID